MLSAARPLWSVARGIHTTDCGEASPIKCECNCPPPSTACVRNSNARFPCKSALNILCNKIQCSRAFLERWCPLSLNKSAHLLSLRLRMLNVIQGRHAHPMPNHAVLFAPSNISSNRWNTCPIRSDVRATERTDIHACLQRMHLLLYKEVMRKMVAMNAGQTAGTHPPCSPASWQPSA